VANHLDAVIMEDLRRFDEEGLMDDLDSGKAEACGGGPTVAVMAALKALGATTMEIVHHCNSGDVTLDTTSVVGYVAAVAYA
jgi:MEMO1 family protein